MGATRDEHGEESEAVGAIEIRAGVLAVRMGRRRPVSAVGELVRILSQHADSLGPGQSLRAVVDLKGRPFSPSGQEMRYGALRLAALSGEHVRIALVVEDDFQYGLGRMLGLLTEDAGLDVRPFRDGESAWAWVESVDTAGQGA